jgi:uncharacterized protein
MPEVIINGPEGRLEGRYHPSEQENAPIALVLHADPQFKGNMNSKVCYYLYHSFVRRGFSVLRFNFRSVGRSEGVFDNGIGELSDAASALDWLHMVNRDSPQAWVAGFSFGSWIGMQLLMRRPEINGFLSISPPANLYDFSFLAPCPSSGLITHGTEDTLVTENSVQKLVDKLHTQKGIAIDYDKIDGASHFYEEHHQPLVSSIDRYLTKRLGY